MPKPPPHLPHNLPQIDWQPPPAASVLHLGAVHLWRIRTDASGAAISDGWALLPEPQRQRALALRVPEHRARYIRTHAALRQILSFYLAVAPTALAFSYGANGKPALPAPAPLAFNLTTSGNLALVALTATDEIGVDCEQLRPQRRLNAIAERMFDAETVAALTAAASEETRLARFYQAWTALEADAKCDGRGLFRPRAAAARPPAIAHFIPESGYLAAVACAQLPPISVWHTFTLSPFAAGVE